MSLRETLLNGVERLRAARDEQKRLNVQDFAHANRSLLIMVFDPKDDMMFASFGDKQISAKIRSIDGREYEVVKGVLDQSSFHDQIDRFLGGVIDIMRTPLEIGKHFYFFIDSALFNLSKALNKPHATTTQDGGGRSGEGIERGGDGEQDEIRGGLIGGEAKESSR
jgi:hypothetical protein